MKNILREIEDKFEEDYVFQFDKEYNERNFPKTKKKKVDEKF